jgi:hypothetical protein
MMSAPWSIRVAAASASRPGSYQEFTQITRTCMSGFTFRAASWKALIPITTSGDREGADVADDPRLAHVACDGADHRPAFMEAAVVDRDVLGGLVAGGVLELHVGELLGDPDRRIHEAEGRGEDDVVLGRELADDALGIGAFGDVLDVGRGDAVAERRLDVAAADIMAVGPAVITHRADIDEAGADMVLLGAEQARRGENGSTGGGGAEQVTA